MRTPSLLSFLDNDHLICPIDQLPLIRCDNHLSCESGHSFDIARQGYVNLLLANEKRSKDPGDSKEMVGARSHFLDAGHYSALAEKLADLLIGLPGDKGTIVDAGCGEGYYLKHLHDRFLDTDLVSTTLLGYDISKWAVQAAARRFPATWLVASNRNIPLRDQSADVLLSLFGFPAYDSFHRLLKTDGILVLANAGPQHLIELREVIYPTVNVSNSNELAQAKAAGFTLVESTAVQYQIPSLSQSEIGQLLLMTPHLFRASREGRNKAQLLETISLSVDVELQVLRTPAAYVS